MRTADNNVPGEGPLLSPSRRKQVSSADAGGGGDDNVCLGTVVAGDDDAGAGAGAGAPVSRGAAAAANVILRAGAAADAAAAAAVPRIIVACDYGIVPRFKGSRLGRSESGRVFEMYLSGGGGLDTFGWLASCHNGWNLRQRFNLSGLGLSLVKL